MAAHLDAFAGESFGRLHGLVEGDASTDHGHLVLRTLLHNLQRPATVEGLALQLISLAQKVTLHLPIWKGSSLA